MRRTTAIAVAACVATGASVGAGGVAGAAGAGAAGAGAAGAGASGASAGGISGAPTAGDAGASARRPVRIAPPPEVRIGAPRLSAATIGRASAPVSLLVPVRYPLHMKARAARLVVTFLDGGRTVARAVATPTLSAGLERDGADARRGFRFVHRVVVPSRVRPLLAADDGLLSLRLRATAVLDADRDGRAEARSADSARRSVRLPRLGAEGMLCSTPEPARVRAGRTVVVPLPQCTVAMRWRLAGRPEHGKVIRTRRAVAYRAARDAHGWDGLTLTGRRADRSASAAASAAVASELPILVGGAASSVRVRAIGDSITAGFGWYSTGAPMSGWSLPWCRPGARLNDACSSNSTTTSNSAPLVYAPDYGLSNKVAWPAQWAAANGITDFANYAVTGSAPSDWRPGGAFYPQLRAATDSRPDYIVFTLGANPLLSNVLFGIDNMKCAIWSDLFGDFTRCVLNAFASVNLTGNLTALYAELLARTPATTKIIAMQYYTAVPSIALAYSSQQLERMSDLLDGVIASTVAAAGSPRLRTLAPPRFNVGIDMSPLVQPSFSCFSGGMVDGPSAQSTLTQDEFKIDPLIDAFCGGTPWIISADSGIHPEVAGHAQIASVLPTP